MLKILSLIASAGLAAAAMATVGFAQPQEDGATADPRLGKEVRNICFQSTINSWKAIKGEDDVVLLERGVNHWYRVELAGGCRSNILRSALTIGIDSRPAGGCVSRGDVIIVRETHGFDRRCVITKMYEWDEDAGAADETSEETPEGEAN